MKHFRDTWELGILPEAQARTSILNSLGQLVATGNIKALAELLKQTLSEQQVND